jgi:taurine dioxygenase
MDLLSHISVRPLTTVIGAEVEGVNLSLPLSDEVFSEIYAAWLEWGALFFRDQDLSFDQQIAFSERFGSLYSNLLPQAPRASGHPELIVIHADENSVRANGETWHADITPDREPPMASVLYLTEAPAAGGDTLFANMAAVYDDLSEPMKEFLCGLTAIHDRGITYNSQIDTTKTVAPSAAERGPAKDDLRFSHPVVRTHPVTGRRLMFVNEFYTSHIEGLDPEESRTILNFLFERVRQPRYQCRFRWTTNSVAVWDNRAVQHQATFDYFPRRRHGYRATIRGDRPFFQP